MNRYYEPIIFQQFPHLIAIETTRLNGVSLSPYQSLNLGQNTNDAFANVLQNRQLLFDDLGINAKNVVFNHQIHEDKILNATQAGNFSGYDALISNQPNLFLTIGVADCTPILIFDAKNQAFAAIHAGWRGTVKQIIAKTLVDMQQNFGTEATNCFAYIGTCIDECSFEVDADVADNFASDFKYWEETKQKFFIDLKKANRQQLIDFGIPAMQIEISKFSTVLNNDTYFSYRKEKGETGRFMILIGLKS